MKEIQTTHNKEGIIATDEWYTPLEFIEQFGKFDVDPCVPINMKWKTAEVMYNKNDDGLSKEWEGRIWLNPPYSKELISAFLKKMGEHKNGIALVLPKFTSKLFREEVFPNVDGIFILKNRIKFYDYNWIQQKSPIANSVLLVYGDSNISAVEKSGVEGTWLYTNKYLNEIIGF